MYTWVVTSRCLAFRALITQHELQKGFELKNSSSLLDLPISSSAVVFFLAWANTLSEKNPYFGKHLFCKTRTDNARTRFVRKTSRLVRISLLISALNKRVLLFSSWKIFYKGYRKFFAFVCISWYKHSRGWENSRPLCKPETKSSVCIKISNSPNPSRVYIRLFKHGKRFLFFKYNPGSGTMTIYF